MGTIITFYSYKGGVGRSMALANIAVLIAQQKKRVLIIDWDLEAPGLEYYFNNYVSIDSLHSKPGLIDLLLELKEGKNLKFEKFENELELENQTKLSLITAGKKDNNYAFKVHSFNYDEFYEEHNGEQKLESLKEYWRLNFDFIFIDSRTGITDVGGICTIQMPDIVVLMANLMRQSYEGLAKVGSKVLSGIDLLRIEKAGILLLPIPSRVDFISERQLLDEELTLFSNLLTSLILPWWPFSLDPDSEKYLPAKEFFLKVAIPSIPKFGYKESLPVLEENTKEEGGIYNAYERISAIILNQMRDMDVFLDSNDYAKNVFSGKIELLRHKKKGRKIINIFFSYSHSEFENMKETISEILIRLNYNYFENKIFYNVLAGENLSAGDNHSNYINTLVQNAEIVIPILGNRIARFTEQEIKLSIEKNKNIFPFVKKSHSNIPNFLKEWHTVLFQNEEELIELVSSTILKKTVNFTQIISPITLTLNNEFLGREEELITVKSKFSNNQSIVLLQGEDGIGKTAIASQYWKENFENYKYAAWLFCDNGIINALKELAPKLNLDLNGLDDNQQLVQLRAVLSQIQYNFLLILDNADDKEDIKLFKQEFEGFNWHVLITGRCQGAVDKEQELRINPLSLNFEKKLFSTYYSEPSNPSFESNQEKLFNLIGDNTLLIESFAKYLSKARGVISIKDLIDEINKIEPDIALNFDDRFKISTDYSNIKLKQSEISIDKIINKLFDFSQLAPKELLFLKCFAKISDRPLTFNKVCSKLEFDKKQIREWLNELSGNGWIQVFEDKYQLTFLLRSYILKDTTNEEVSDHLSSPTEKLTGTEKLIINEQKKNTEEIHISNVEISANFKVQEVLSDEFLKFEEKTYKYQNIEINYEIENQRNTDIIQSVLNESTLEKTEEYIRSLLNKYENTKSDKYIYLACTLLLNSRFDISQSIVNTAYWILVEGSDEYDTFNLFEPLSPRDKLLSAFADSNYIEKIYDFLCEKYLNEYRPMSHYYSLLFLIFEIPVKCKNEKLINSTYEVFQETALIYKNVRDDNTIYTQDSINYIINLCKNTNDSHKLIGFFLLREAIRSSYIEKKEVYKTVIQYQEFFINSLNLTNDENIVYQLSQILFFTFKFDKKLESLMEEVSNNSWKAGEDLFQTSDLSNGNIISKNLYKVNSNFYKLNLMPLTAFFIENELNSYIFIQKNIAYYTDYQICYRIVPFLILSKRKEVFISNFLPYFIEHKDNYLRLLGEDIKSYFETGIFNNRLIIKSQNNRVFKISGRDSTGRSAYYFVLIEKNKVQDFLKHKVGDTYNLEDYGKIVYSAYGEKVPREVKEMLKEKYGFDNLNNNDEDDE